MRRRLPQRWSSPAGHQRTTAGRRMRPAAQRQVVSGQFSMSERGMRTVSAFVAFFGLLWLLRVSRGVVAIGLVILLYSLAALAMVEFFRVAAASGSVWGDSRALYVRMNAVEKASRGPLFVLMAWNKVAAILLIGASILMESRWWTLAVFATAVLLFNRVRALQPPLVLFFAASNEMSRRLQRALVRATMPHHQTLSLLKFHNRDRFDAYAKQSSRRTRDTAEWRNVAANLLDLTKLVVVDTRHATPAVVEEAEQIARAAVAFKTIFVVDDDRSHLVLNAVEPALLSELREVPRLKESEVISAVSYL